MPPEPRVEPEVLAKAAACDWRPGSSAAWFLKTSWRRARKCGFSVREEGTGGIWVVVPIESAGDGGEVGRRVRI
jgi:hypothetical protein